MANDERSSGGGGQRGPGRPSLLSDEDAVWLAKEKFAPMLVGDPMLDDTKLAEELTRLWRDSGILPGDKPIQAKVVQRAVIRAFNRGLVRLTEPRRDSVIAAPPFEVFFDRDFMVQLKRVFAPHVQKLKGVFVVKSLQEDVSNVQRHAQVGAAMALKFDEFNPLARDGDKPSAIAISSGRFCQAFCEHVPTQTGLHDVTVINLSGSIFKQESYAGPDLSRRLDFALDSDTLMTSLARKINPERLSTEPILGGAAVKYPSERDERLKMYGLGAFLKRHEEDPVAAVSIVGLGNYSYQHRLYRAITLPDTDPPVRKTKDIDKILEDVAPLLTALADKADAIMTYGVPSPICDIANRIFVAVPPYRVGGREISLHTDHLKYFDTDGTDEYKSWRAQKPKDGRKPGDLDLPGPDQLAKWTFHELVREINSRMITVTKTELAQTEVWLGVGTPEKAESTLETFKRTDPEHIMWADPFHEGAPLDLVSYLFIDEEIRARLGQLVPLWLEDKKSAQELRRKLKQAKT